MQFERITFSNAYGQKLAARLDLPLDKSPLGFAIFAHCFTCTKNLNAVVNINRALTKEGLAVLRFDFTGLGESEGDFAETGFSSNVEDLISAANFLADHYQPPKLLIGHSLGGAAALLAARHIDSVRAVATIGAPADTTHLVRIFAGNRAEIDRQGVAEVTLSGKRIRIGKRFLDDLEQTRMEDAIKRLRRALLIIHSPDDNIVKIEHGEKIFRVARYPKSFVCLENADHLLSRKRDSLYVGQLVAAWVRRYVGFEPESLSISQMTEKQVEVRTGSIGFRTEINAAGHRLLADEPIALGGSNTGPTPYDLLSAALGSCTSITLRMYADRKGWPLESVNVTLKHRKIHAKDCQECEQKVGKIDFIERKLDLEGPLTDEQKQRLLQIADQCPVHRSFQAGVVVRTHLKES